MLKVNRLSVKLIFIHATYFYTFWFNFRNIFEDIASYPLSNESNEIRDMKYLSKALVSCEIVSIKIDIIFLS